VLDGSPRLPDQSGSADIHPLRYAGGVSNRVDSSKMALAETTSEIGVPKAERELTEAAVLDARLLLRPGSGRSLLVLSEVQLGIGRPDLLLLSVSRRALEARARAELRLANLTEARVLAALNNGGASGHSAGHVRTVGTRLQETGWIRSSGEVTPVRSTIGDSMLIEAKTGDWRTGLQQLTRNRWASHFSALLMPVESQRRVPRRSLRHNHLGLLVLNGRGLRWQIKPPRSSLSWLADVWLTELAIRELEAES